jgi:hypothetical protein
MRIDLTSGEQTALSEPGVYRPRDLPQPYSFDQPLAEWMPALSPDFRFLALPDPAGSGTINQGSFVSDIAVAPGNRYLAIATPDGLELRRMDDGSLAGFVNRQMYWVEFLEQGEDLFLVGMDGNGVVDAWRIDA